MSITIDLAIYGSLAKLAGGKHLTKMDLELESGSRIEDLFARFNICPEDTSFIFINAVLCDVPGLNASKKEVLHDGDHVGIFSHGYMWPYQYRDGMPMSNSLKQAMREHGALHHTYTNK
ncbi:MAG: hypothetical protein JW757_01735 [Anaerolineales bacterium]|nr:hypothetical protein [Anaerolineales bacterium]